MQFALLSLKLEVPQQDWRGNPLDLDQQVAWCWQQWQPPQGRVLVVLDDVTDWKHCRGMLPTDNRFCVLMTTRLRRLDTNFVELPLDVLSEAEALQLLTAILGENDRRLVGGLVGWASRPPGGEKGRQDAYPTSPREEKGGQDAHPTSPREEKGGQDAHPTSPEDAYSTDAKQLCKWLGYLPLGLELVARYLVEDPDLSLAEMLQRLQAQSLQDEAIDVSEADLDATEMTARRGVKAAFELSWQELNPITQHIGQLLSLFKPTVIPWELVTFSSETQSLGWTTQEINSAKKELYKLSLIDRIDNKKYKIHPLLRYFFQIKLADSEQATAITETFLAAIEAFYNKLGNEILEQHINDIEDEVAEYFEQREFEEYWNKDNDFTLPLQDITVTIDEVKTTQKKLLDVGKDLFKFELIVEIDFTPEGSYPDLDLSYSDSEEGEEVFLNHITEVEEKNTATITVKVEIAFDENDPDINEVEFVVNEPIKFDRQPTEVYSDWDYNNGED